MYATGVATALEKALAFHDGRDYTEYLYVNPLLFVSSLWKNLLSQQSCAQAVKGFGVYRVTSSCMWN